MRVAVTGAAGAIGSEVVAGLAAAGVDPVALVRDPARVRTPGAVAAEVDYGDRDSLDRALAGADRLVLVGSDGEADRVLVHHRNILDAARAAGVDCIVLLSSQDADPASPFCYAHTYAATEDWLVGACPRPSILRAGLYAEFFGRWVLAAASSGELSLPMAAGSVAPVARADVAAALVAAVLAPESDPGARTITGPAGFDHDQLAGLAAEVAARPVASRPCTPEEFAHRLVGAESEPWWRYAFSTLFAAIAEGRFAATTTTFTRLTGRAPIEFGPALRALSGATGAAR